MAEQRIFDFCVCGNGMVGSAMALALSKLGFEVAWIAAESVNPFSEGDKPDLRMSAISLGSVQLLESLGVWNDVIAMRTKPYTGLRVWEIDGIETAFSASEIDQDCLGVFVENRLIQLACEQQAAKQSNISRFNQAVESVVSAADSVLVLLNDGTSVSSRYVIGAEGAQSKVRKSAGIATRSWQYAQQALGIIVEIDGDVGEETWQQFYASGPRAFLPMYDNFAALIWYDDPTRLKALQALSDAALTAEIKQAFPNRLQSIKSISGCGQFPLTRMHASEYVKGRTILVGDAAHTVNPLAGQGVNLGFGDVKAISNILKDKDIDALPFYYGVKHRQKNRVMMTALEAIYHTFSNNSAPFQWLRNAGLFAAQNSGPAKKEVIRFAAGL